MLFDLLEISFKNGCCIFVPAYLRPYDGNGPDRRFELFLDTGASSTHISKELLCRMGYNDSMFTKDKKESFAVIGKYRANLCRIKQFNFCGVSFHNHTVKVWDPPAKHHADGIIGMNILRYFNITINVDIQRVNIEQSQATKAILLQSRKR